MDIDRHIAYVTAHLRDRIAARTLVDHLEEHDDLTRAEAVAAVARLLVTARRSHALALATRMNRPGSRYHYTLHVLCEHAAGCTVGSSPVIIITDGWHPPRRTMRRSRQWMTQTYTVWVTVGARWVIATMRTHLRRISQLKIQFKALAPTNAPRTVRHPHTAQGRVRHLTPTRKQS
jgi:hypothetical protein